jgi:hypothetical protein
MSHPDSRDLALYAGGELDFFNRLRLARHVRGCTACRTEAARFESQRAAVREHAPLIPADVNWDSLASEMRANIRLGLAASECIAHTQRRGASPVWRLAAISVGVVVFLAGGWWVGTHPATPGPQTAVTVQAEPKPESGTILNATVSGVGLERNGHGLTLTYAGSPALTAVTAGTRGSVNARYVDEETGQVTIHHVYSE